MLPARGLSSFVSLVQVAVYARGLPSDSYIASQSAIAAVGLLLLFADCGITIWTTREAIQRPGPLVRSALSTRLAWFCILYSTLIAVLSLGSGSARSVREDLLCLCAYGVAFVIRTHVFGLFRAEYGGIPEGWIGPVTNLIESGIAIVVFW